MCSNGNSISIQIDLSKDIFNFDDKISIFNYLKLSTKNTYLFDVFSNFFFMNVIFTFIDGI